MISDLSFAAAIFLNKKERVVFGLGIRLKQQNPCLQPFAACEKSSAGRELSQLGGVDVILLTGYLPM